MTTRWSPDTCDCVVEYDDPENPATYRSINRCAKHSASISDAAHVTTLFAHNRRKNAVAEWLRGRGHKIAGDDDSAGGVLVEFDRNASAITDPVRIRGSRLGAAAKAALQAAIDARFGAGSVDLLD